MSTATDPKALFHAVAAHLGECIGEPGGTGFGSDALKVNGKIFATLTKGRLLLKLPHDRVESLIDSGVGQRFSTGAGRVKKEWVTVAPTTLDDWITLSIEARSYVGSQIYS